MTDAIIKVSGALKGVVRLPSGFDSTTGELRKEIARLLGLSDPSTVKLIAGGRTLQDDSKPLSQYNITPNTRQPVLVTKGAAAQSSLAGEEAAQRNEEARLAHLERLKATVEKMASRGDGRGLTDRYEFSLENQDGSRLQLSESDRKALVFGLALHEKGRASLAAGKVQDALDELLLAEESFSMVTSSLLEGIDNLAMLLLDIVWCYFKQRDISRLGVCGDRLASARRMLEKAHGPNLERLRLLHGNFSPELTTYVRLELLEGVVAYHSGDQQAARQRLQAAQAHWQKLQLSEAALLQLAELGYSDKKASRALRFSGGNVAAAVDFLTAQQEKQKERKEQRRRQSKWLKERVKYGKTSSGKYVDSESLDQLCQLGYERSLAAEALRQAENDANAALDVLADPVRRGALQLALIAQQMLEEESGPQHVKHSHVKQLMEMGFKEKAARIALAAAGDKVEAALERLQAMGEEARVAADDARMEELGDAAAGESSKKSRHDRSTADADAAGPSSRAEAGNDATAADAMQVDGEAATGGSSSSDDADHDVEAEVLATVGKGKDDPLAAYDVDVTEDGEAIQMYLSLLATAGGTS